MQAAVEGLIDFRTADHDDPRWWTRYNLIIRTMRRGHDAEIYKQALGRNLALLGNGRLTSSSFDKAQEAAKENFWDVVGCYRPWEGESYTARKVEEFDGHRQQYIDTFGVDPADPAFKAWEAEQIAKLAAAPPPPPTDEQLMRQKLAEKYTRGS